MRKRFSTTFVLCLVAITALTAFYYRDFRHRNTLLDSWYSGHRNVRLEGVRFVNSDGQKMTLSDPGLMSTLDGAIKYKQFSPGWTSAFAAEFLLNGKWCGYGMMDISPSGSVHLGVPDRPEWYPMENREFKYCQFNIDKDSADLALQVIQRCLPIDK
jgi:hypothetical protein